MNNARRIGHGRDPAPHDPARAGSAAGRTEARGQWWKSRTVRAGVLALVVFFGGVVMRLTSLAESLAFYFPLRGEVATPGDFEDVWITTPEGVKLHAWFMPALATPGGADSDKPGDDVASPSRRPAILHCHGNAGNIEHHLEFSNFLRARGFHVLLFDYRGFGRSEPARLLNRHQLARDSLAAFDALASRADVDAKRIGLYGVSLGGTMALSVAVERPEAAAICTVSAFASWRGIAGDHAGLLGRTLIPSGLDAEKLATRIGDRPMLVVHGMDDTIVPESHATRIAEAARAAGIDARLALIEHAEHNDIAMFPAMQEAVGEFFVRALD
ncbi:MAG: alpha/beta fold hydrolase [Planctomycetota bacterium]|nr:alpha/beta fold hydrolase [Planctomycetota bacterium]